MRHRSHSLLWWVVLIASPLFAYARPSSENATGPQVRAHALTEAPSGASAVSAALPEHASDLLQRLQAARSAALSPGQPVPRAISPFRAAAAPIAERIGLDVTLVRRPGTGTPMQIRGDALFERAAVAALGEDLDLTTARGFLRANRSVVGLDDPDVELAVRQRIGDELGLAHIKFEQRWRGLSVWPAELIVHLDRQGRVYLMDGAYVFTPHLRSSSPVVTASDAASLARAAAGGRASVRDGSTELIVYAPVGRTPRLAWRIETVGRPEETAQVVVDAVNATVLARIPLAWPENVSGSGVNLFGQTVALNVWHTATGFELVDTSKSMFRNGCNVDDIKANCGAIYVGDAGHTPSNSSPDPSQATISLVTSSNATSWTPADAVSAAFNFSKVYDYYLQRHNRTSIDGNGGNILAVTRLGAGYHNAFWLDSFGGMFFGDADKYAGSLDVVGHEMTHGVTSKTAGLLYQDQSGALNEAISDIFGEMVERFATGSNDWLHDTGLARQARNLADPSAIEIIAGSGRFYPGKMSDYIGAGDSLLANFVNGDNGGVHINSGIINHAYYLLAQGEPGAIGSSDAERIFYRALTLHLTKNAQFLDARVAAIQAANELFGQGSNQSLRTAQAFDGVEILGATPAPPPPSGPPVSGADSLLFISRNGSHLAVSRREAARGDGSLGAFLFPTQAIAEEKLAVSGDGALGFFVTSDNDACFFNTDATGSLSCLGLPGTIAAVAMSRDTNVFSLVLQSGGVRENLIRVIDLPGSTNTTFTLKTPATDAGTVGTVLFADTMEFTANRRFLFYDALNVVRLTGGTQVGLWSIFAIDFVSGQSYTIVPPIAGLDVDNPAVARTSDDYLTFEAINQSDGKAAVFAEKLSTGALNSVVVNVPSAPLGPAYTGDDRGIVYSYPDSSQPTGRSIALESLAADRLTPVGNPQAAYLLDGAYPLVYRRGTYSAPAPNCTASSTTLCLSAGRFQVSSTFTTSTGQQGLGQAVRLTSDTGYFTFFDPANVEVVVKVLNGCGFNKRLWVFAGGLTNVATVITVTDTTTGVTRTYGNPQGSAFLPIQDTSAFSTCFVATNALSSAIVREAGFAAPAETFPASDTDLAPQAATACISDAQSLCLNNGRFRVQTSFLTNTGQSGAGNAVRLTGDTGYFWFFDPNNVEMVVKALNGCGFNSRFWVFAGGLTNVRVTTTVTDTQTGTIKTYTNPLNQAFQPLQDTAAFLCP